MRRWVDGWMGGRIRLTQEKPRGELQVHVIFSKPHKLLSQFGLSCHVIVARRRHSLVLTAAGSHDEPLTEACLSVFLIHLTWCASYLTVAPQLHPYLLPSILYCQDLVSTNYIPQTPLVAVLFNSGKRKKHYFLLIFFCFRWCFWK